MRYRRLPVADVQLFKLQRVRRGNAQKGLDMLGTHLFFFASRRITHIQHIPPDYRGVVQFFRKTAGIIGSSLDCIELYVRPGE